MVENAEASHKGESCCIVLRELWRKMYVDAEQDVKAASCYDMERARICLEKKGWKLVAGCPYGLVPGRSVCAGE